MRSSRETESLTHPTRLSAPCLDFQTGETTKSRYPSLDPAQNLRAPSIRRLFGEWLGEHNPPPHPARENAR